MSSTQRQGCLTRSGTHHGPGNTYTLPLILASTILNKYNYQPHRTDGELEEWRDDDRESESEVAQSCPTLCNPMTMGFSRQEDWSGLPFPSPEDHPDTGTEPRSPTLQADTLLSEPPGKAIHWGDVNPSLCVEQVIPLKHFASFIPTPVSPLTYSELQTHLRSLPPVLATL